MHVFDLSIHTISGVSCSKAGLGRWGKTAFRDNTWSIKQRSSRGGREACYWYGNGSVTQDFLSSKIYFNPNFQIVKLWVKSGKDKQVSDTFHVWV